jgi:hypothetical protein
MQWRLRAEVGPAAEQRLSPLPHAWFVPTTDCTVYMDRLIISASVKPAMSYQKVIDKG